MNKILNSTTPASVAEEYIVNSIWSGQFSPGNSLPSERCLAEVIGVTRTTLREVLQRLARSGWLSIQHGKRTIINNVWETASLNILDTLVELDNKGSMQLPEQLLEFKTQLSSIYYRLAIKNDAIAMGKIFSKAYELEDLASAYVLFDWQAQRQCALLTGNPIYTLALNGFEKTFFKVGHSYFNNEETRSLAKAHYLDICKISLNGNISQLNSLIWHYAKESSNLLRSISSLEQTV